MNVDGADLGMIIMAKDISNPVLLVCGGGPGIPEYLMEDMYPSSLADKFMVCMNLAAESIAGVLLILSTVAKDVKQATSIAPALMMVLMVASMLTVVESFGEIVDDLGAINACIPAWNTMAVMQDVVACDYSPEFVAITCIVNLLLAAVAIFITGRLFENEKIVNG
ncbi:MAG: hypothetical protein J6K17_05760 [Oscillospiraceae bacterium]|nr:hypothetical protein [Oscillospiraceae bacterium]